MVLTEAFAFGTPAAVSDLGPLPSIVRQGENGVVFEAGTPDSIVRELRRCWGAPGLLERLGHGARRSFETCYSEDASYEQLMAIFERAIAASGGRGGARSE
jgi:glycosyltransferase involved in cell wall biosynthesis